MLVYWFDDVVVVNGDKLVVWFVVMMIGSEGGDYFIYKQFDDKMNVIVVVLMENGVFRGQYVVVYQELMLDWICLILGIFKIGVVYVLLDLGMFVVWFVMVVVICYFVVFFVDKMI